MFLHLFTLLLYISRFRDRSTLRQPHLRTQLDANLCGDARKAVAELPARKPFNINVHQHLLFQRGTDDAQVHIHTYGHHSKVSQIATRPWQGFVFSAITLSHPLFFSFFSIV